MAGAGTQTGIRSASRLAATYGGAVEDWAKMTSSTYTGIDAVQFATHWYQNVRTGLAVEFKTKLITADKQLKAIADGLVN